MRAVSDKQNSLSIESHIQMLKCISVRPEEDTGALLENFQGLPPFLRALLVADGTVTLLLRAYFDELIQVDTLEQSSFTINEPLAHLHLKTGDEAFYRRVVLTGAESHRTYANALSLLNPAALKPELFDPLIEETVGMGEVLRNSARGSYREVLDVRAINKFEISRTYTVILDGHPAILITETFDRRWF